MSGASTFFHGATDTRRSDPGRAGSANQPEQLRTEFSFLLPRGYVDPSGTVEIIERAVANVSTHTRLWDK